MLQAAFFRENEKDGGLWGRSAAGLLHSCLHLHVAAGGAKLLGAGDLGKAEDEEGFSSLFTQSPDLGWRNPAMGIRTRQEQWHARHNQGYRVLPRSRLEL